MIPIANGLGKAFIEIHADTRPFAKEVFVEVKAILEAVEKTIGPASKKLGESIGEKVSEGVKTKGKRISETLKQAVDRDRPTVNVDVDVDRRGFRAFLNSTKTQILGLGSTIKDSFGSIFSGLKTFVANIFNIPEKSPLTSVLTVLAVGVLPALIPLVIALAAAIADLAGFLFLVPPALSAIIALVPPLILGFGAIADAVELAFTSDPKKFREGLRALSPLMQSLTKTIREFAPAIEDIGARIQNAFIGPLTKVLAPVLERLVPLIGRGLEGVSAALGRQLAQFVDFLGSPTFESFLNKLFPSVIRMIDRLGPSIIRLFDAFTVASEKTLPFLERFADGFGDLIDRFAMWIEAAAQDGRLEDFLEDAFASLEDIAALTGSILGLFHTWFTETDDEGRTLLEIFTELFQQFDTFFRSENGRKLLGDLADLAIIFADNLKLIIPIAFSLLLPFIEISIAINKIILFIRIMIEALKQALGLKNSLDNTNKFIKSRTNVQGTPFAEGGFVTRPTAALVGEAGPELIIPLTKPNRAAALLHEAGLLGPMNVYVFLGSSQITDILDIRVDRKLEQQARSIANGPRST